MKIIKSTAASLAGAIAASLLIVGTASAHVIVTPKEGLTGSYQTFSISAPNERDSDYTTIKLDIPSGLTSVSPTVEAGWTITADKTGEGETATTTAITWTGDVPAGQRAQFSFSAKLPDKAAELDWKVEQTYADGTVISWNQKPTASETDNDDATTGPYSITQVVAETAQDKTDAANTSAVNSAKSNARLSVIIATVALASSLIILSRSMKK